MGIRVSEEEEMIGCDSAEIGMEAYPDFQRVSFGGSSGVSGYGPSTLSRK
jgi:Amt family ammonium transporter